MTVNARAPFRLSIAPERFSNIEREWIEGINRLRFQMRFFMLFNDGRRRRTSSGLETVYCRSYSTARRWDGTRRYKIGSVYNDNRKQNEAGGRTETVNDVFFLHRSGLVFLFSFLCFIYRVDCDEATRVISTTTNVCT